MRTSSMLAAVLVLFLLPPVLLVAAYALSWVDASTAIHALIGMGIAALGGVLTGLVAERTLHRGANGTVHLAGLVLTTGLAVLTIGYLYLVHIKGPMSTIGELGRAIEQGLAFGEFLTALIAGALLAPHLLPTRAMPPEH